MYKILLKISGFVIGMLLLIGLFLYLSEWFLPEWHGSYSLGKGVYMIEWDSPGKIIVQGTNVSGRTCYGGTLLVPSYENEYDSYGNYNEYVVNAVHNMDWIVAYTYSIKEKNYKYYTIDKSLINNDICANDITERFIRMYLDKDSFIHFCDSINISPNNVLFQ